MSAAFDMVDHSILLQKLTRTYGENGVALEWLKPYLRDRHQMVEHEGTRSTKRNLIYGVPQGSVLGQILFLLYTGEINDIIERYGLHSQCYADDCQVHSSSKPVEKERLQQITLVIDGLSSWMASNRLKLHQDKSKFIWIASSGRKHSPITGNGLSITPSSTVRLLEAHLDETICFETHVSKIVSACFF